MSNRSSPPSAVKPSQRERNRYVLVEVKSHGVLPRHFPQALKQRVDESFGLLDAAKASVTVTKTYRDTQHVILRVAHTYCDHLIKTVKTITELCDQDVDVDTTITSGIIKQVKDHYQKTR